MVTRASASARCVAYVKEYQLDESIIAIRTTNGTFVLTLYSFPAILNVCS